MEGRRETCACRDTRVNFIQNKKPNMIIHSAEIASMPHHPVFVLFMQALAGEHWPHGQQHGNINV